MPLGVLRNAGRRHAVLDVAERTSVDVSKVPLGGHQRPAIRCTGLSEFLATYHSPLMPVSLMIGPHFSVSDAIRAASSIGVEVMTGAPIASYLCFTDGCSSAATASE